MGSTITYVDIYLYIHYLFLLHGEEVEGNSFESSLTASREQTANV